MKKYLIICENQESADKVNDFIAVNSLFAEGETITEPVARWGKSYTDEERVYNAVCAYIQEGGKGVKVYNLREFEFVKDNIELCKDDEGRTQIHRLSPTVYRINIDEDHITVNGYQMNVKYKYGYTYKLLKTYIGTSAPEELAHFIQDESWKHSACPQTIPIACKMCALNLMVHGMCGRVECRDTLRMTEPTVVYVINEVKYPISTPYYSVRKILAESRK